MKTDSGILAIVPGVLGLVFNMAHAGDFTEAPPVVSTQPGCLQSPASQSGAGNTGAITLLKVTSVSVNMGGDVVIKASDGVFNPAYKNANNDAEWNKARRTGQTTTIRFALDPSASTNTSAGTVSADLIKRAKKVADECVNNARIAMTTGMTLQVGGKWNFHGEPGWAGGCWAEARDKPWIDWTWNGGTYQWGSVNGCTLQVSDPNDRSIPVISGGSGSVTQ